jgi:sigma-B regulation protein RsbU (phosphoserine phosphatase)
MDHKLLSQVQLFKNLPETELEKLAAAMKLVEIPPGTTLFTEGDPGELFYVVADGALEVIKALGTPNERLIAVRRQGEFIGELSLINPAGVRMASVRTSSGARMWQLSREEFDAIIHQNPLMAYEMVRELSKRLTTAHESTIQDLQKKNQELTVAYQDLKEAQEQIIIKERLEKELEVAHNIQKSILPEMIPAPGEVNFGAFLQPARAVGGDFYDLFQLDANKFGLMIGDVADKGVPSALVMAQTHALIFAEAFREQSPDRVLHKVNDHILEINRSGLFVTAIYGVVDTQRRTFHFARAGHEIPLIRSDSNPPELIPHHQGQPLGLFEEPVFDLQRIELRPGSSLLLYTDGLLDVRGEDGSQFGMPRLMSAYAKTSGQSPQATCDHLWDQLSRFQGDTPQYDDVTMIVIGTAD